MNNKNNRKTEVGAPSNGMKYKILSHTADLRFEVYGKTIEELFINAAEALADILGGRQKLLSRVKTVTEKIKIQSANTNTLLVDFLNEILARSQINKRVYKVESLKLKDNEIEAEISGASVDKFEEDIKAVTYHEVDIKKEDDLYKTRLVLDI